MPLGDLNAHTGSDAGVQNGVTGKQC